MRVITLCPSGDDAALLQIAPLVLFVVHKIMLISHINVTHWSIGQMEQSELHQNEFAWTLGEAHVSIHVCLLQKKTHNSTVTTRTLRSTDVRLLNV